jgi:hypothetical protein
MAESRKGVLSDPEVRARAIAARRATPHGQRNVKKERLPGYWPGALLDADGRPTQRTERLASALQAIRQAEGLDDELFLAIRAVLKGVITREGRKLTTPEALVMNKLLDKRLPDLRADTQVGTSKTTRFVIGAPLRRLVEAGATVAGEITETTAPAEETPDGHPDSE